jgi:hypothetical protein
MKEKLLCLILSFLFLGATKAETPDTLVGYWTNSGKKVLTKDSADFYRVILPPDSNIDKELYRVYEYYPNGKLKMVGTSLTNQSHFFPNGKRKSTIEYKNGRMKGSLTNYYPNGKIYDVLNVEASNYAYNGYLINSIFNYKFQILEMRDSTGKIIASNGTGHIVVFDDDFKTILYEGEMLKDKKEGEWKGAIADSGRYVCYFHKDELKSGISYMKSGNHYNFTKIETNA